MRSTASRVRRSVERSRFGVTGSGSAAHDSSEYEARSRGGRRRREGLDEGVEAEVVAVAGDGAGPT